jgi:drug/metabolite transporter (DMT)-like permease
MRAKDGFLLAILSILWGGSFLFVEIALTELAPVTLVFARVSLAALILGLSLYLWGAAFPATWRQWRALFCMGLLNNVVPFCLFAFAQGQITGSLAAILNATTPFFAILVAHLLTIDEKLTLPKVFGVCIGFSGVVITVGRDFGGDASAAPVVSVLACLGAALSYGFASVWGRRFGGLGVKPLATAFGQLMASTLILLPVWLVVDQPWTLAMPSLKVWLAVFGIAALSSALAYFLYFRLLVRIGSTNLSLVTFVIPISAAILGWLFLAEPLLLRHYLGFGVIVCGLLAIDGRVRRWFA